jgi:hypothetical protein
MGGVRAGHGGRIRGREEEEKKKRRRREEEEKKRTLSEEDWPNVEWQSRLTHWLASQIGDDWTVEDLAQETLLHTMLVAQRRALFDRSTIESLGFGIARNLVARERRRFGKAPRTNRDADLLARACGADAVDDLERVTREQLGAMRAWLEPKLGRKQRALLAAVLDLGIVTVRGLAARLRTEPANVRRMLGGIARQIALLA